MQSASNNLFGWIDRPREVERVLARMPMPLFSSAAPHLAGSGDGKVVLLYEAVRKVWGRDFDEGPQLIGDCVSWGFSGSVDALACVEVLAGEKEEHSWDLRTCTEAVYALSRVEYGNLDGSTEDGSVGAWAAEAVVKGGTLPRKVLGAYDPSRAKQWGARGLPDQYEPEARQHTVKTASLVRTWEEAKQALSNGYPIPICSMVGFENGGNGTTVRDSQGFARPRGQWAHCMKLLAVRDDHRPGALICNSWPKGSVTGPKGDFDIPDVSWWADAEVIQQILRANDSFALSSFNGFPKQNLPLEWIFA